MKTPDKIYLQIEDETGDEYLELNYCSWCQDRINKSDIEYVRKDIANQMNKEEILKPLIELRDKTTDPEKLKRISSAIAAINVACDVAFLLRLYLVLIPFSSTGKERFEPGERTLNKGWQLSRSGDNSELEVNPLEVDLDSPNVMVIESSVSAITQSIKEEE